MLLCTGKYFALTILAAYKCEIRTEQFYNQSDAKKLLNLIFWIIMGGGPPGIAHFGRGGLKPEIFDIFCLKFDLQGP